MNVRWEDVQEDYKKKDERIAELFTAAFFAEIN